nr:SGNH/GDSL hydrolase family protein [Herbaspirillum sp. B39]
MLSKRGIVAGLALLLTTGAGSASELLEIYGDSTLMGVDGGALAQNPSDIRLVASPVQDFISIPGFAIHNSSVSGDSTKTVLNGHYANLRWPEMARASCATVMLFNYGINDSLTISEKEYVANLKTIIRSARGNGHDVILQTPNPSKLGGVAHYAEIMRKVAREEGIPVIDVQQYFSSIIPASQRSEFIPDGTHPNQQGYELIGKYMQVRLKEILLERRIAAQLPLRSARELQEGARRVLRK